MILSSHLYIGGHWKW